MMATKATGVTSRLDVASPAIVRRSNKAKASRATPLMTRRMDSHTGEVGSSPIAKVTTTAPPMRVRSRTEAPGTCRPELTGGRMSRAHRA